jgi:uncharacterized RmlC-like cupin family protein
VSEAPVRVVRAGERTPGEPTPGLSREEALVGPGFWSGLVETEPGNVSGWHHHGEYDTLVYVIAGALRVEAGPDGADVSEAGPDDFMLIPKGVVHREANPGDDLFTAVVVRVGTGQPVFNVDGPQPSASG